METNHPPRFHPELCERTCACEARSESLHASWILLFLLHILNISHLQNRDFDDCAGLQHLGLENLCKPELFPEFAILTLMQTSPFVSPRYF